MSGGVKLEGFRELDRALGELGKSTERTVLRRIAKRALGLFVDRAKELVPVDTGDLRDSIVIGNRLTKNAKRAERGEPKGGVKVFAGTASRHGSATEYGTILVGPRPFMRPAMAETEGPMIALIGRELGGEIVKTAARAAKRKAK